ncbi:cardioacceleratory peptide receptor-like [Ylistrum balloti]|uniref:cardioacceleratory peptide receptor-like n=1 Tax=Ylistrum balloti TaxID=509963 RepID=UPI002905CD4C|nr:cardioacceleratory peptide receptor-like [Ylistrum balloti]
MKSTLNLTNQTLDMTMDLITNLTEDYSKGRETYTDHKLLWNIATGIICAEFVFAFALNAIVIGLLLRNKKRNRMSFFVLHLAISDFLMAVFYIFPAVIDRLLDAWLAGLFMCKLIKYLNLVVCFASTYMLVVLSIDRLYAIARPLSATRRGIVYQWTLVSFAWVIAAMLGIYDPIFADILTGIPTPRHETPFCEIAYPEHMKKPMILLFAIVNMFVPVLIIGLCYSTIVAMIWRRGRQGVLLRKHEHTVKSHCDVYTANRLKPNSGIIHRAKVKTIKITFVVVSVFLVSWGPFTIYTILMVYHVINLNGSFFIFMTLAPLNSVANPIVYLFFNHRLLRKGKQPRDTNGISIKATFITHIRRDSEWSKTMQMSRLN